VSVLTVVGYPNAKVLGEGGEAVTYALSDNEVLRVLKAGANSSDFYDRCTLTQRIHTAASELDFATPEIFDCIEVNGRLATRERRLPGLALDKYLNNCTERERTAALIKWLDTAEKLSTLPLDPALLLPPDVISEGYRYGNTMVDPTGHPPRYHRNFQAFWRHQLQSHLNSRGEQYLHVDVHAIVSALPEPTRPALVHLDLFSGNLLWHEDQVWVFAATPSPAHHSFDAGVVIQWLENHGWLGYLPAAERMVAAYWSFVVDDKPLDAWCQRTLAH